jgi:hypothetical protein
MCPVPCSPGALPGVTQRGAVTRAKKRATSARSCGRSALLELTDRFHLGLRVLVLLLVSAGGGAERNCSLVSMANASRCATGAGSPRPEDNWRDLPLTGLLVGGDVKWRRACRAVAGALTIPSRPRRPHRRRCRHLLAGAVRDRRERTRSGGVEAGRAREVAAQHPCAAATAAASGEAPAGAVIVPRYGS